MILIIAILIGLCSLIDNAPSSIEFVRKDFPSTYLEISTRSVI
jgi:hypothetical protein